MSDKSKIILKGSVCTIVDTPYQLLNCINIIYHAKKNNPIKVDLYVSRSDFFSRERIQKLKETGLFDNIYSFKEVDEFKIKENFIQFSKLRVKRFFFSKRYISDLCENKRLLSGKKYDQILCAFNVAIVMAFSMVFPKANIVLFDEGTSSYINGMAPITKKRDIMFFLKGVKNPWRTIDTIFINNEKYYVKGFAKEAVQMESLGNCSPELLEMIKSVFDYKGGEVYKEHRFIYLVQPFLPYNEAENNKREKLVNETIEKLIPTCLVRNHPKQTKPYDTKLSFDEENDMWELVCAQTICDDHVIIGRYSTAQFTPKLIYDKEPWIVFTYKLFVSDFSKEQDDAIETMMERLKNDYSNPEKVVIVNSVSELIQTIGIIKMSKGNETDAI